MEFSRAMSEKDEDYRLRELALQEKHSRDLAKQSQTAAEEMMAAVQPSDEDGNERQGRDGSGTETTGARERKSTKVRAARKFFDLRKKLIDRHGLNRSYNTKPSNAYKM